MDGEPHSGTGEQDVWVKEGYIMAKYRIKIEAVHPEEMELSASYRVGIECDGFAIIGDCGDEAGTTIEGMSIYDIAECIATSPELLEAAIIAAAIDDAKERTDRLRRDEVMARIVNRFKEELE